MEAVAKLLIGLCLLAFSLALLYRPGLVLRINEILRDVFLNDAYVLHYRRRWGMPLFAASILFLYSGIANLTKDSSGPTASYVDMNEAYRMFYTRQYEEAERLCREVLRLHPQDTHALFLLQQSRKTLESLPHPSTVTRSADPHS